MTGDESTGPTGPTDVTEASGPTGPSEASGPTGPSETLPPMELSAPSPDNTVLSFEEIMASPPIVENIVNSGPSGPEISNIPPEPVIIPIVPITIEELMESYNAKIAQEELDKSTVSILLNESTESLKTSLLQWAAARFPATYIIKSITLNIPFVCSDGVSRTVSEYFMYCLGTDMVGLLEKLKEKVTGVQFGYSFENNTLRIHVTRS